MDEPLKRVALVAHNSPAIIAAGWFKSSTFTCPGICGKILSSLTENINWLDPSFFSRLISGNKL
jgi:hypothetical protein